MGFRSKLTALAFAVSISLSLTACDPPIPESLLIAQAELEVQCEEGEATLSTSESLGDLALSWSDASSIACETMLISPLTDAAGEADLELAEQSQISEGCQPFVTVPVAVDAAVLVTNIPDYFEIYLDANQIIKIFNGSITNWSDPELIPNNEEYPLPDLQIVLPSEATPSAKAALTDWIGRLAGEPLDLSSVADAQDQTEQDFAIPVAEGAISIASISAATFIGSSVVAIVQEPGNSDSIIRPDYEAMLSAKSQLVTSFDNSVLSLKLDPSIAPQAEEGLSEAVAPYQAIYPVKMAICGEDTILKRTVARYLLRQDSQGIIAVSALMPLPEQVRIEAIQIVAEGLPVPSIEPVSP